MALLKFRSEPGSASGNTGKKDVAQLSAQFINCSSDVREEVREQLVAIGNKHAVRFLRDSLSHRNPDVRQHAAIGVGDLKDKGSRKLLSTMLSESIRWTLRQTAADALGKIHDTRATEVLVAAANDESAMVRLSVGKALAAIEHPKAETIFASLVNEKDEALAKTAKQLLDELEVDEN